MESGGALGTEKKDRKTFLERIGGRIIYKMKGPFVPLALALPNTTRKAQSRFTSELQ